MQQRPEFFNATHSTLLNEVQAEVRREAFGDDIGQMGYLTAGEYRTCLAWMDLHSDQDVLDVACGTGGPALFLTQTVGCRVTGIDINERGIADATQRAADAGLHAQVHFQVADAHEPLPFAPSTFDALVCTEAIPHFPDRLQVLREWFQVVKPGARLLYTDGGVLTGLISNEEVAMRSGGTGLMGFTMMFIPLGMNEKLLEQAGFRVMRCDDVTENQIGVAERRHAARQRHRADLVQLEGQERFDMMQSIDAMVRRLGGEQRLLRMAYVAEKPTA